MNYTTISLTKEENVNLVNNPKYNKVIDSLKVILDNRITAARKKPKGLGRQFKNAKPNFEPKEFTPQKNPNYEKIYPNTFSYLIYF